MTLSRSFLLILALLATPSCRNSSVPVEKVDGAVEARSSSGELLYAREWRKGLPHGTWREYRKGKLVSEGHYLDGVRCGAWRTWYEDGRLKSEGSYLNGVEHGPWLAWHENGQPSFEAHYLKGNRFGLMRSWAPDGRLLSRDYFP